MLRRGFRFLLLSCALSGCASLTQFDAPAPVPAAVVVPRRTPAEAYQAGVQALIRGDDEAARREWDRCLAISTPDSSERLDCLVARERLAYPAANEP